MRASISSIKCRIFCFHCGGTIWRTGALGQFESAQAPGRARSRRLARMLRQTQGAFAPLGTQLISSRAGAINQWSASRFRSARLMGPGLFPLPAEPACLLGAAAVGALVPFESNLRPSLL